MNTVVSHLLSNEIELRARPGFPRRLTLWRGSADLQVCLYPAKGYKHLVFCCARFAECRLQLSDDVTLWVDGTAFKLHSDEIPAVREFLTSAGIRIVERKPPSSTEAA